MENGASNNGSNTSTITTNGSLCLCFPCIIYYLGGYVPASSDDQIYPQLVRKGFSPAEQKAIAEEWYWISVERETAINDYLSGNITFRDGCVWRRPPLPPSVRASNSNSRYSNSRPSTSSASSSISGPNT